MSLIFFRQLFGNDTAQRVISGAIAFSMLGNLVVQTFTASRGKYGRSPTLDLLSDTSYPYSQAGNRQRSNSTMVIILRNGALHTFCPDQS